jgi:cyclopropane fatty-acyl-phospholipid synthase-like methyltransferase
MGGSHFNSDSAFLDSAVAEVDRLAAFTGLTATSRLLDWGCGAGRLGIGVAEKFGQIGLYHGVDVQEPLVRWAKRHIGRRAGLEFTYVDLANARYNPTGSSEQRIPGRDTDYDIFYAYSVFSHLSGSDAAAYFREVARLLRPDGKAFITAFVEDGVPPEEENPSGYGPLEWAGPLHCVRFSRPKFDSMIEDAGLSVQEILPSGETDGQSLFILQKDSRDPST